ncbi:HlyD family secretion protein [Longimicrobium sp.]|uniref:HlyD family secretion protein n=1 Tax=Longimicrobium sp. TaxID=2029185 RepID=UPI002E360472|nr:HlyD family efflux transporter periplasmic adaptor subunit [Longimicrobium sp.]HEX6039625.1 HlyD family efflux transporter periplasmic adaptor subunit [Longimicrobium sp.]
MSQARATTEKVIPLRLPMLGDEGQPGGRFVKRAVSVTLGVIGLLMLAGIIVSLVVRMDVTVKSAGVLEPVRVWPVRAASAGAVRTIHVQSGDTVKANEIIAELDVLALRTQLAQLEAQHRSFEIERNRSAATAPLELRQQSDRRAGAQARLSTARASLLQRMVEHGFGTNVDSMLASYRVGQHVALDAAVGEVRGAEADIRLNSTETDMLGLRQYEQEKAGAEMQRLEAQMTEVRERIARATIRAPSDGVVLTDQLERLTGSYVQEGQTLMEVGEQGEWRVTMLVPERDVNKIAVGDRVRLEVQAFSEKDRTQLEARVSFVAAEPVGSGTEAAGAGAAAGGAGRASGPGVYRVVATLAPGQADRAALDKFRRGYSVQANVITRSGRIAELGWDYLMERLNRK